MTAPAYEAVTTQDALRVLIDRTKCQHRNLANIVVLAQLRSALRWLEMHAAEERGDDNAALDILALPVPESEPVCVGCGHLRCKRSHAP